MAVANAPTMGTTVREAAEVYGRLRGCEERKVSTAGRGSDEAGHDEPGIAERMAQVGGFIVEERSGSTRSSAVRWSHDRTD